MSSPNTNENKSVCQCEHSAHFDENIRTPNGYFGHSYNAHFPYFQLVTSATEYGVFQLCKTCNDDCIKDYVSHTKVEK